jgi:DNA-directed RNA polymerase subunit RPC12/RpoP
MPFDFRFACPQCGAILHGKNEWIGRTASCKRCQHRLVVPPRSSAAQHPPLDTQRTVEQPPITPVAAPGTKPRRTPSALYQPVVQGADDYSARSGDPERTPTAPVTGRSSPGTPPQAPDIPERSHLPVEASGILSDRNATQSNTAGQRVCKWCKNGVPQTAGPCPHCGKYPVDIPLEISDKIQEWSGTIIAVIVGGLLGALLGVPISYFCQPGFFRAAVSLGAYMSHFGKFSQLPLLSSTATGTMMFCAIACAVIAGFLFSWRQTTLRNVPGPATSTDHLKP